MRKRKKEKQRKQMDRNKRKVIIRPPILKTKMSKKTYKITLKFKNNFIFTKKKP
jgi:hypothetical protein